MTEGSVLTIVNQIASLEQPDPKALEQIFSTKLEPTEDNPYWETYDFTIASGPFESGDLRLSEEQQTHISLWTRSDADLTEGELDFSNWGDVIDIQIFPRIPPEGIDSFVYLLGEVQVSVQFTHDTRQLQSVALDWGVIEDEV